ncbi:MAG: hypothetical protein HKO59_16545 [Phycisphaerales bacterium]|nr:hypothetical protein [Phycisphaerae bacterium]NNF44527.1 hypothetical protein [Phycisphaerales bacterium]NNM27560.1 hypothetical protein [Phycisphaerales bacterium]
MTTARKQLVDPTTSGVYHCISRCVRRAYLCGENWSHRKDAIKQRLMVLTDAFAIDVGGYAILDNHFHTVLRTHPERVSTWTPHEVAERWSRIFPKSIVRWAREHLSFRAADPGERAACRRLNLTAAVNIVATDEIRIATLRERLSSLSWFMKCLKEWIACVANREDGCRGHFFEARFKSLRVLGSLALLSTLIYVDLNVVRALKASTPESSDYTSAQDRIHVREIHETRLGLRRRASKQATDLQHRMMRATKRTSLVATRGQGESTPEDNIWLAPIDATRHVDGLLDMDLDGYLTLLDASGRLVRRGNQGVIAAEVPPILARLQVEADQWGDAVAAAGELIGTVIGGSRQDREAEAQRRGNQWVSGARMPRQKR